MPVAATDALVRDLEHGTRGGVYFLFGDDELLKEEALAAILRVHLDPTTRDFNFDQLNGAELDADHLASAIQTPPLMAEWRVVLVREAQALAGAARARRVVEDALENPPPGVALILLAQIPAGSQAQFYQRLKRSALAVSCQPPEAQDLPGWVVDRARRDGLQIEIDAARALAAAAGPALARLASELAKLRDFVGDERPVTLADVRQIVTGVPRQNRWEWFDLVADQKFRDARSGMRVLLDAGESGVGLVLGLGTHFLRLAIAAAGGQKALENALPPQQRRWLAPRIARQARQWDQARLDAAVDDLLRADRLLKSAPLDDLEVLDELLFRLQARTGRAA